MRQLLLVWLGTARRETRGRVSPGERAALMLRRGIPLMSLTLLVVSCASHSLMPDEQAIAIKKRDRALAAHSRSIQEAIRHSGQVGALAFLDATDGGLVVLPGNSPTNSWARYTSAPPGTGSTASVSVPPVVTFVYRADVPKAPEPVTHVSLLQEREETQAAEARARALQIALETELRDEHRRTQEQLATVSAQISQVQRELSDSIAAAKQGMQDSLAAAREDMQKALNVLAQDLAAARKFMLQTAQLSWLNQELNVENANGIRKISAASQELTSSSARLADTMRQLSENLAAQLKELAGRLENIQSRISAIK
jgi:G:T/U-mismatch repair DNA glycosylase